MPPSLAALRRSIEASLRIPSPFVFRDGRLAETVSTGIPALDSLVGGLPRGGLTEICGPLGAGRTSLLFSALAARTAAAEVCALVDGRDGFDPHAAAAAGVGLPQLLWVRCRNIEQTVRAADLLLHGGGFGLVVLDLSDLPVESVRSVPLSVWFRFRRAVEGSRTALLLLNQQPHAKSCASLVLKLNPGSARWVSAAEADATADSRRLHPAACLLDRVSIRAELYRSRLRPASSSSPPRSGPPAATAGNTVAFETSIAREYSGGPPGIEWHEPAPFLR